MSSRDRLRRAVEGSRAMVSVEQVRTADPSGVDGGLGASVRAWLLASGLWRVLQSARGFLAGLAAGSSFLGSVLTLEHWIKTSWLYRWLTAEPEPDVIVIDLRETVTVGPVLAVLDRVIDLLARGTCSSSVYTTGVTIHERIARASIWDSRVVALAIALLEPPEPPERAPDADRDRERER